ncbi:MAG: NAD(P)/FAD-dependent oxidoreductase [Paracoccaceae bacterium]
MPTRKQQFEPRVTVVGGGIVGICSALSLAEAGVQVRLIDRDAPGQGASHGNAGVIGPGCVLPNAMPGLWRDLPKMLLRSDGPLHLRAGYLPRFIPFGVKFLLQSRAARVREVASAMEFLNRGNLDIYRRHLAGTGQEGLICDSYFIHATRNPAKVRESALERELHAQFGIETEVIGAAELRALEPALATDFQGAVVMKGQGRSLSPGRVGTALADKFRAMGGEILQADVLRLFPNEQDGWHISTSQGDMHAPKVVLSAGAWSARLLQPLGIDLPLEGERGYHAFFSGAAVQVNHSVMDNDLKVVASCMASGVRVAGTAEFSGLDHPPSDKRRKLVIAGARRMLPDLRDAQARSWSGLRPTLPDSLPVLGEIKGLPGLVGAFGHSHWGFMMAPRTGQIVAELVQGKPVNADLSPYRSDRF